MCSGVFFHFQFEQLSRDVQRTLQGESPTYEAVAWSTNKKIVHVMRCCACLIDVEKLFRCHVSKIVGNNAISKFVCAHSTVFSYCWRTCETAWSNISPQFVQTIKF